MEELPSIDKKSSACPCCLRPAVSIEVIGAFNEYQCHHCDHTWFDWSSTVTRSDYEKSSKYDDYYVGIPPYLWYHRNANDYIKKRASRPRILDFGCYDGFFTKLLVDQGFDAYGCDWNRIALTRGRTAFGLGERLTTSPTGEYDIVMALEVIEHFEDPNYFLDIVLGSLKGNGELIISCPNKNAIYRPATDAPPHHFSRFSINSLRTLLERRGLKIIIHKHEMSSFQLLRNIAGDTLRHDAPLSRTELQHKSDHPGYIRPLKRLANSAAAGLSTVLTPVDFIMHRVGLSYISQFVVARRADGS